MPPPHVLNKQDFPNESAALYIPPESMQYDIDAKNILKGYFYTYINLTEQTVFNTLTLSPSKGRTPQIVNHGIKRCLLKTYTFLYQTHTRVNEQS